jgi:hypothetical protein
MDSADYFLYFGPKQKFPQSHTLSQAMPSYLQLNENQGSRCFKVTRQNKNRTGNLNLANNNIHEHNNLG